MKAIINPNNGVKTAELIKLSAETFYYIVCDSDHKAREIFECAKDSGFDIPFPMTFDEFLNKRFHPPGVKGFLIDGIDKMLTYLSWCRPIAAITLTCENPELLEQTK